jgi:hypothetical protein
MGTGIRPTECMNPEQVAFLSLLHLPGRFTVEQTAWYLGFPAREIPSLARARLLKPAGRPGSKASKVYSYPLLRRLKNSDRWIERASALIYRATERKNQKARGKRKRKS